jgi:uncharacterized Zn finger protein (UPF0148 family)
VESGTRDLIVRGIAAARSGDHEEARFYLEWALRRGDAEETQEEKVYLWLSEVYADPAKKRECLEEILAGNPYHPEARRKLALLEGRLDPDDVVNPDDLTPQTDAERSLCPACGGPLFFSPDGTHQTCERCGWRTGDAKQTARTPSELLTAGIAAAKTKRADEARRTLEAVTQHEAAQPHQQVQAWLWLSGVYRDADRRRAALDAVLRLDPDHAAAQAGLARLQAQAANKPKTAPSPTSLEARRMICPSCGGKLIADAGEVRCAYCGYHSTLLEALKRGLARDATVDEQDFALTLATSKGHSHPVGMRSLSCQTCRADFLLGPGVLSLTCPYCGSSYVAETDETRTLIPPEAVLPFAVNHDAAYRAYQRWLDAEVERVAAVSEDVFGLYLPVWTFDVGGVLRWRRGTPGAGLKGTDEPELRISFSGGLHLDIEDNVDAGRTERGELAVDVDDAVVAASHTLPADLLRVLEGFDLSMLQPYRPGQLSDWPAEVYEIPVSDASLAARQKVVSGFRRRVPPGAALDSSQMMIYAYKLVLLPVWLSRYKFEEKRYRVVINGQTGSVHGQTPPGWFKKLFKGFLGGG